MRPAGTCCRTTSTTWCWSGGTHLTRSLVYVDNKVVDGAVNGTAAGFGGLSGRLRRLQNGFARSYAVSMFGGAAVLIAATLLMRAV